MPKVVDHEERREVFTDAAIDVIASAGLESLRLVDVAREAGVTTGSLGHYFEDKGALLDATLERVVAQMTQQAETGEGSLIDRLAGFLPLDASGKRLARVWMAFTARALVDRDMARKLARYWEAYTESLERYLRDREGRDAGEAQELAVAIIAIVDGLTIRVVSDPRAWSASRQREQLEVSVDRLLGPPASPRARRR